MDKSYKTLVVGVDFSNYSKLVVKQALRLQKYWGSRVILVHATPTLPSLPEEMYFAADLIKDLKRELEKTYRTKTSDTLVEYGDPADLLIRVANSVPDPLIVVGHRGQSNLARYFLGSTAEQVGLKSAVPVWVHRGNKVIAPKTVLIPHDLTPSSDRALQVAKHLWSRPTFLTVTTEVQPVLDIQTWNNINQKRVAFTRRGVKKLHKRFPKITLRRLKGEPAEQILRASKKFDAIAMTHRRRFPSWGSVTAKVIRSAKVPVIVAH